mgnify:CR=1 FL=1
MYQKRILRKLLAVYALMTILIGYFPLVSAAETYTGKINTDKVFFRTKANTDCDYHAVLKVNTKVAVLGIQGDFYKARFDSKEGYIMKKFVDLPSSSQRKLAKTDEIISNSKYAKASSIKALGDPPGYVRYGASGEDVEKLQRALQLKKCYSGIVDGKFGNQTRDALKKYQEKNKLTVTGKADYSTIRSLFGGVQETSIKDDPKMKGITSIAQIDVPNTTKANNSGRHVIALQQALKLKGFFKAPIDGKYGDKTLEAVTKYQKSVGLSADGVAGNGTIKRLFGKNAANYTIPTEKLDWFNGGSTVIPKGAIFTVKDIYSGKTFSAKRWSGYNHVDAEPLNADSTAAFKDAVGGSWSWARRPVLIKYNGHVYAASINSMPHGDDTISGNNYEGHFCIHFYKSKTHETNRIDNVHQNAVQRAMNASW